MSFNNIDEVSEEDIDVVAYMLFHLIKTCHNCGTRKTPMWRKGPNIPIRKRCWMCNACGIQYQRKKKIQN